MPLYFKRNIHIIEMEILENNTREDHYLQHHVVDDIIYIKINTYAYKLPIILGYGFSMRSFFFHSQCTHDTSFLELLYRIVFHSAFHTVKKKNCEGL